MKNVLKEDGSINGFFRKKGHGAKKNVVAFSQQCPREMEPDSTGIIILRDRCSVSFWFGIGVNILRSFYLNSSQLKYSVILVSGVQYSDSTLPYITWCSSQQVHSFIPFTCFPHPPHLPSGYHQFAFYSEASGSWFASFFFPLLVCLLNSPYE